MEKQIAPWNIKPGMRLVVADFNGPSIRTVATIEKRKGHFTGRSIWTVKFTDEWLNSPALHLHAAFRSLPGQKASLVTAA